MMESALPKRAATAERACLNNVSLTGIRIPDPSKVATSLFRSSGFSCRTSACLPVVRRTLCAARAASASRSLSFTCTLDVSKELKQVVTDLTQLFDALHMLPQLMQVVFERLNMLQSRVQSAFISS